ncbi:hypothetical protein ACIBQX_35370 [Nonomuraea sp. NPDC049714]|jgi:hypothetical protein|uniref:hypothetical protein n=1 Tax=Nonomuraea sp. NPDC049714 TaxID=3364357 RepID=UPI0037BAA4FB
MLSIVRRSALAGALAMSLAVATVGFAPPSAAATPPYGLLKLVFRCAHVGGVSVTVVGPGVAGSARDSNGTYYFRGRPGAYRVKRLANGRIAPRSRLIQIPKFSTRTVNVCSLKWPGRP